MARSTPSNSKLFCSDPMWRTLLMLASVKVRCIFPLIGGAVDRIWRTKPIAAILAVILGFNVVEIYRHTVIGRISKAVSSAALHDAYYAHADQMASFETERWMELAISGFHSLPNWLAFIGSGKQSDLNATYTVNERPKDRWVWYARRTNGPLFFGALHIAVADIARDYALWNFSWEPRVGPLVLPWGWHGEEYNSRANEPAGSLRLRFLVLSERVGDYVAALNSKNPGRSPFLENLIHSGQWHLNAAEQSAAEAEALTGTGNPSSAPPELSRQHHRRNATRPPAPHAAGGSSNQTAASSQRLGMPEAVNAGISLEFAELSPRQSEKLARDENVQLAFGVTDYLGPFTELRRELDTHGVPRRVDTVEGPAFIVWADGRRGLIKLADYSNTHPRAGDLQQTTDDEKLERAVIVRDDVRVRFYVLNEDEKDLVIDHRYANYVQKTPVILRPGTELRRLLTAQGYPLSGSIFGTNAGWLVMVNHTYGLIPPEDFKAVQPKGER